MHFLFILSNLLLADLASAIKNIRMPPLCQVKYYHSMAYSDLDQTFIIFGGIDGNEQMPIRVSKFYPESTDCIEQLEVSTYLPYGRSHHCSFYEKFTNSLLVIGGNTKFGITNEFLTFSLFSYSWRSYYDILPEPLAYMSCDTDDQFGYIYGGYNRTGLSDRLYRLNFKTYSIERLITSGDIPNPRSYASIAYSDNSIYLWGGKSESGVDLKLYKLYLSNLTWVVQESKNNEILAERWHHRSLATKNSVFIFPGIPYSNIVYQYFINDKFWISIEYEHFENRFGYSLLKLNDTAYIYGGRNSMLVYNEILKIDLSDNISINKFTNNSMILPPRVFGATAALFDGFVIFGGQTYKNEKLNDLWSYTTKNNTWTQLRASGSIPSKRSLTLFTSFGYNFYIFGGESVNGLESSLYSLNLIDSTWQIITPKNSGPSPRSSGCSCGSSPYIFLYGGYTANGWNDELWMYNIATFTYKMLSFNSLLSPRNVFIRSCIVITKDDNIELLFPSTISSKSYFFIYSLKLQGWKQPLHIDQQTKAYKLTSSKLSENMLSLGIQEVREKPTQMNVYSFDVNSEKTQFQWAAPLYMDDGYNIVLGNEIFKFGGIYKYVNTVAMLMPLNWVYLFQEIGDYTCTPGFYFFGQKCVPCPPGYYNELFQSNSCTPCPIGTFNKYIAANSKLACLPCPFATFSDIPGSSLCFECPPNYFCPTGSNKPLLSISRVTSLSVSQPDYILGNHQIYVELRNKTILFIIFLTLFLSLLMLLNPLRKRIGKMDIFRSMRFNNTRDLIIYDKTKLGGYISSMAFTVGLYFIITILITFLIDNYNETKTIAPVMLEKTKILGEFRIELFFELYGGQCVDSTNQCAHGIYFTEVMSSVEKSGIQCVKEENGCRIFITYLGIALSLQSSINIQISEPQSYASSISINITSNSSIPEQSSSIFYIIYPDLENDVFRGIIPTLLSFKAIGSIFTYEGLTQTGYHIMIDRVFSKGSEVDFKSFFAENGIFVSFNFELSDVILLTNRSNKMTIVTYLLKSLNSFLGIVSIFRSLYKIFREVYLMFSRTKNIKKLKQKEIYTIKES